MASGGGIWSSKAAVEEKEKEELGVSATVLAVGAVAALVAWGISKWLGSSDPEPEQNVKMMKAPGRDGYIPRQQFEDNPKAHFRKLRDKS